MKTPHTFLLSLNLIFAVLLISILILAGCKPKYQLDVAPVHGKVTLDGEPVTAGYVIVLAEKGRMARGAIDSQGSFALTTYQKDDGAQVGTHTVVITSPPSDEGRPKVPSAKTIPLKYSISQQSGLSITVEASKENEVEFALVSSNSR